MVETYKLKPLRANKGEKMFLLSIREKLAQEPQTCTQNAPDSPEILPDPEREVGAPTLMQLRRRKLPPRVRVVRPKVVKVKPPQADPRLLQLENYLIARNRSKHAILTQIPAVFARASLISHLRKSVSTVSRALYIKINQFHIKSNQEAHWVKPNLIPRNLGDE